MSTLLHSQPYPRRPAFPPHLRRDRLQRRRRGAHHSRRPDCPRPRWSGRRRYTQSRCLRLAFKSPSEVVAVRQLLGHRIPLDARQAKSEWCYCGGVLSKSMTLWKESTPSGQE